MSAPPESIEPDTDPTEPAPARKTVGLVRRLAAIFYDSLLCLAILFAATAVLLPFTEGEAVGSGTWWYTMYLLVVCYGYFGWFWTHDGQTLGMMAWRFEVRTESGRRLNWQDAAVRFAAALLAWAPAGLGFLWALFDPQRLAWHDRLSGTKLVHRESRG